MIDSLRERGHLLVVAQTAPRNGPPAGFRSTNGTARQRSVLGTHRGSEGRRRRRLSFDAIIVWRLDGNIESWNRGAEQLYGYSENKALGHVTHELLRTIHPTPWPEIEARLRECGQWEGELRHLTRKGQKSSICKPLSGLIDI